MGMAKTAQILSISYFRVVFRAINLRSDVFEFIVGSLGGSQKPAGSGSESW